MGDPTLGTHYTLETVRKRKLIYFNELTYFQTKNQNKKTKTKPTMRFMKDEIKF